jgi:hypothetical protein
MIRIATRFFFALVLGIAALNAAAAMPNFDQLEQRLKIRPEQKDQYDFAVGATKRALLAVGLVAMQAKERLTAELMKPNPDFRSLLRSQQDVFDQVRPQFQEAGDEWKKLYALLDDEQVEIAKAFVRENLGKLVD